MNCPTCGQRNPSHADQCLHCNASFTVEPAGRRGPGGSESSGPPAGFGTPGGPEPAGEGDGFSANTIVTIVLIVGLFGAFVAKKDEIKEWFWTSDRRATKCISKSEALTTTRYTPENGWHQYELSMFSKEKKAGKVCFEKNLGPLTDTVDERFQPDSVKNSEGE